MLDSIIASLHLYFPFRLWELHEFLVRLTTIQVHWSKMSALYGVYRAMCYLRSLFIVESAIVVRKIRQCDPGISSSNCQIFTVVSFPFLLFFAISMLYRYALVYWFVSFESVFSRFIVAIMTPALPFSHLQHMALWSSSQMISSERACVLMFQTVLYQGFSVNYTNGDLFSLFK